MENTDPSICPVSGAYGESAVWRRELPDVEITNGWRREERTGSREIPRFLIMAHPRRSMVSSRPITTGSLLGMKVATSSHHKHHHLVPGRRGERGPEWLHPFSSLLGISRPVASRIRPSTQSHAWAERDSGRPRFRPRHMSADRHFGTMKMAKPKLTTGAAVVPLAQKRENGHARLRLR